MTQIICLSGRKQSGKSTTANYMVGQVLFGVGLIHEAFHVNDGHLWVSDIHGAKNQEGYLDITQSPSEDGWDFLVSEVYPLVKLYSFADLLKQEVCIKILGLSYEMCYGTDEEKNQETHLKWEDMPGSGLRDLSNNEIIGEINPPYVMTETGLKCQTRPLSGSMTAREVMQYVGTDIFRKMYGNVWVDATLRQIQQESPELAIITDGRFPNEINGVRAAGGYSIRLTRSIADDNHDSETALDNYSDFDTIIDNSSLSIPQQCMEVSNVMHGLSKYFPVFTDVMQALKQ